MANSKKTQFIAFQTETGIVDLQTQVNSWLASLNNNVRIVSQTLAFQHGSTLTIGIFFEALFFQANQMP
ncbi:MAG: hypothetical protein C5B59_08065 [Bacteroidetes bacterium]|nr:MAG: hypothetical protein C5B59_08065 [Bacteroidota bacterium]